MSLLTALRSVAKPDKSVTVKIGGKKETVRLKHPSYADVLDWGERSARIEKRVADGEFAAATAALEQAVLVLRKTMVVDENQEALSDEDTALLIENSGGLVRGADLVTQARDIMWAAAGFDGALEAGLVDEAATKGELPFELPEDTG